MPFSHRIPVVLALSAFASVVGCGMFGGGGEKQTMLTSSEVPAGEGTVEAKKGPNDNTLLKVEVKHLASPSKVADDASVYVVWIQPHGGAIQNVGALSVDDELVGKLETTTPHQAFKVMVTPEPSARMAAPTHKAVFSADLTRKD